MAGTGGGGGLGDTRLVARLRAGDPTALEELYDRCAPLVFGLARRICASTSLAEDVTQEVFVHVWTHADRIDFTRGTLRAYLGMVTHRRAVDVVRAEESRRAREARDATRAPVGAGDVDDVSAARRDADTVRSALAALPPEQRAVVTLTYLEGRSYRDTAVQLGIPEGTAKSRGRLALAKLEAALVRQGVTPWT